MYLCTNYYSSILFAIIPQNNYYYRCSVVSVHTGKRVTVAFKFLCLKPNIVKLTSGTNRGIRFVPNSVITILHNCSTCTFERVDNSPPAAYKSYVFLFASCILSKQNIPAI